VELDEGHRPLRDGEVDVWQAALAQPAEKVARLAQILSEDELERAQRFYFEKDRTHFMVARGFLRCTLAAYLGVRPERLCFKYNAFGKPSLALPRISWLRFNLSHAGEIALLAVTAGREIGIDVELIRPGMAEESIPERLFSQSEVDLLRSLPQEHQDNGFFDCWTRKEAFVKAKGQGLSIPLDEFDVSFAPGLPAALLQVRADPGEVARWSMHALRMRAGYAGALVVEGDGVRIRRLTFDPDAALAAGQADKIRARGGES